MRSGLNIKETLRETFPVGLFLCCCLLFGNAAHGQDENPDQKPAAKADAGKKEEAEEPKVVPWIYRPYEIKIWLMFDESARWTTEVKEKLEQRVQQYLETREPSAWRIHVDTLRWGQHDDLRAKDVSVDAFDETLYDSLQEESIDKLFLVRVNDQYSHLELLVNELDTTGWSLGPVFEQKILDPLLLQHSIGSTICDAFRPIARIESMLTENPILSVRAFGLMFRTVQEGEEFKSVADKTSPCWIDDKEIFEPVKRTANRDKKFELSKVEQFEFTLLVQESKVEDRANFECRVVSVNRAEAALGRRGGKQTQRYAIVMRTPPGDSTIYLYTMRGPSFDEMEESPLNGYEIYSRSIYGTDDSTEFLGKTDWRGEMIIPPGEEKVRLLFVKSGERLLARLPIMPGYKPYEKKLLPDDDARIFAEGVVSGLRSQVLDLVARREVLLERMTQSLRQGASGLDSTLAFYEMFDELTDLAGFQDLLATTERRLQSNDSRQQNKIDAMFEELNTFARDTIRPVDDSEIDEMVLAAKQGLWDKVQDLVIKRLARKKREKDAEAAANQEATE